MNNLVKPLLFSLAIVASAMFLGYAFMNRNQPQKTISVTGLGQTDFSSDLIVWEGFFEKENSKLIDGYAGIDKDKHLIKAYLTDKGIPEENIVFKAINIRENTRAIYNADGRYSGQEFLGYILSQSISIESSEVDKVEKISREITELLNQGVQFYSQAPRYYYTQLADLKIELISKATEDAKLRASAIATNADAKLGELIDAQMGIFQITGQNSNEDYSWGGTYNVSAREKTASITMKLKYKIEQ